MKKPYIILVIIAVVVVLGFVFQNIKRLPLSSELPPTPPSGTTGENVSPGYQGLILSNLIKYTDNGFAPSTIKVSKGTKVHFVNQSLRSSMRPASAAHPTHSVYPTKGGCIGSTFDACKDIKPGEEWSFTFDVVGTWKYHNHLNSSQVGTIIVE